MIKKLLEQWFIKNKVKNTHKALHFRKRLSIIYAFVGWNMFGILLYKAVKRKMPEDSEERRIAYGLLSTTSNMHVYQVTGLTLTNDFDTAYKGKVAQVEKENNEAIANKI